MPATGGDIKEVVCNHPVLGTATFYPKANEDSMLDVGGFRSNDDTNGIDGAGNMIDLMTRARPYFECVLSHDNNIRQELEKLVAFAESPVLGTWTVTFVSGAVYRGNGKPVGDVRANPNQATIALKVAGENKFKKIA